LTKKYFAFSKTVEFMQTIAAFFPGRITSLGAAKFGLYETKNKKSNKFLTILNFK